jgi:NADPH:quinone reductase-like Zn-dependent oxidoreductase
MENSREREGWYAIMRAAVHAKTESGRVLQIIEVQTPIPKDSEVLIQTRAASVNPLDWRLKSRQPGVDVAGEVVATGNRVNQFKPGDAVFGTCRGAFAEYVCTSEDALVSKPERITFEQAASVPIAGLTALQGLRDKGNLQPGQRVLINGAAGGVGTFAVQIAKSMGAVVTGVCSAGNVELVRSLGADSVIDYTREDFTGTGQHYDLLLDNVGNRPFSALRRVMAPHGRCVLAGAPKELPAVLSRLLKALLWPPFLPQQFTLYVAKRRKDDLLTLCELMKEGKASPVIDKSYPFACTADAIAYVELGHARAKVVITFE